MSGGDQEQVGSESNAYSAAPSALGYLAQVEYALLLVLRRLDVELEFDVSIETLDDIIFHDGGDATELLQTKHRVDRTASLSNSRKSRPVHTALWCEVRTIEFASSGV
jgi:hypothetical protein